jgi:hypothetical protein
LEKRHRAQQKCYNGIRNQGLKEQLRLGNKKMLNKRNVNKALRQTVVLKVMKLAVGSLSRFKKWVLRHPGRASHHPNEIRDY